ncbi:MAG: DUF3574 domain-containing protein [Gammaproteobacteria bacterium]
MFFGLSRSSGPDVTEKAFQHFIDTEVTPRFPDGLTLLINSRIRLEPSSKKDPKLLILLYPFLLI